MIKNTSQNRSPNHQKSIKNRSTIGPFWEILSSFGRFGRPKGCCGGPRATRKGSGRHRVRSGPAREPILVSIWPQHWPKLGPKNYKKRSKNEQKNSHLWNGNRDPTWGKFGWIWRSKMEPCWLQNRFQNGR